MIWNIFQFFAIHFGKKVKCFSPLFNKEGVSCVNRWNNTEWFIPNDKSFSYGSDPNLKKGIDKNDNNKR